jgi:hypothetical protein
MNKTKKVATMKHRKKMKKMKEKRRVEKSA